jgi:hypothetical protein
MITTKNPSSPSAGRVAPPANARSADQLTRAMAPTVFCPSAQVERCLRPIRSTELSK